MSLLRSSGSSPAAAGTPSAHARQNTLQPSKTATFPSSPTLFLKKRTHRASDSSFKSSSLHVSPRQSAQHLCNPPPTTDHGPIRRYNKGMATKPTKRRAEFDVIEP